MKIHLVDATYELFRAFYAVPRRRSPQGQEVGAVIGWISTLQALLRQQQVTHAACAFDQVIESFRNELFEGYKTGEGVDPELLAQFPLAERGARALGLVVWSMVEFEADDALATAASRFSREERVEQVLLCSPDKDLAQCVVSRRVVCLDRRRGIVLDEAAVRRKFGVAPASIPDFLALVGDPADGIPGLPGWGPRSAAALLGRYGWLEEIPRQARDWEVKVRGAERLAETLRRRWEEALLYRRLATLRQDVPLKETVSELCWKGIRGSEWEELAQVLGKGRWHAQTWRALPVQD